MSLLEISILPLPVSWWEDILSRLIQSPEDARQLRQVCKKFREVVDRVCCRKFTFKFHDHMISYKHFASLPFTPQTIVYDRISPKHVIIPPDGQTLIFKDCEEVDCEMLCKSLTKLQFYRTPVKNFNRDAFPELIIFLVW